MWGWSKNHHTAGNYGKTDNNGCNNSPGNIKACGNNSSSSNSPGKSCPEVRRYTHFCLAVRYFRL